VSRSRTAGLVILALLGVLDIAGLVGFAMEPTPPIAVIIGGAVLGALTVIGVWLAWRSRRGGIALAIGSRVIAALVGIPIFFMDTPGWIQVATAVVMVLTVLGIVLIGAVGRSRPADRLTVASR
jgi:uncharacterized membrane protein (UPF0136 family)